MWFTLLGLLGLAGADRAANERRLATVEAALDRSDPGWRMADLVAARNATCPPDDQNLTKLCEQVVAATPKRFEQWQEETAGDWPKPPHLNRLPTPGVLARATAELHAAPEAVRLALTARRRPTGGWTADPSADPVDGFLPPIRPVRHTAGLLELVSATAAHTRDWPRAVGAAADTLHLCQAVGDAQCLMPLLVRIAVIGLAVRAVERLVGWGEPPAADLAPLQAALLAEADHPRLVAAFRGERAFVHRAYGEVDAGRMKPDVAGVTADRRRLPGTRADMLEFQTVLLAAVRGPSHEQVPLLAAVRPGEPGSDRAELFAASRNVAAADWRAVARLRSAAAGLACERFRQANGRWPNDLAELKELLPTVPHDPFTGQPLRYRRLADGVVVYSVGADETDDGGNLSDSPTPGPGTDIGARLWNVTARRQPASTE